jgi:hypothetical protein
MSFFGIKWPVTNKDSSTNILSVPLISTGRSPDLYPIKTITIVCYVPGTVVTRIIALKTTWP